MCVFNFLQLCSLASFSLTVKLEHIRGEGDFVEELSPLYWPMDMSMGHFLEH